MSSLSSASTRAEVHAAYMDNASYEEDGSATKCRAFITAVRILLSPQFSPARSRGAGRDAGEVELDYLALKSQLDDAQAWLLAAGELLAGTNVKHADFAGFRD